MAKKERMLESGAAMLRRQEQPNSVSWSDELHRIFGIDPVGFVPTRGALRCR